MADLTASSSSVVRGPGSTFCIVSTLPAAANSDTMAVVLPDGVPKDALPIGPANVFTLSDNTYTRDGDIAQVTTHNRSTGTTVYGVGGTVASGAVLVQQYVLVGVG